MQNYSEGHACGGSRRLGVQHKVPYRDNKRIRIYSHRAIRWIAFVGVGASSTSCSESCRWFIQTIRLVLEVVGVSHK
jgi:hypothetical protein